MKKIASVILFLAMVLLIPGCSKIENNATVLNDNAGKLFLQDFLDANHTRGAYYGDTSLDDPQYPESRYFLIQNQEEHEKVFPEEAGLSVDYTGKMLLVYTFTAIYIRPISISNLSIESGGLTVELKMKEPRPGVGDACQPYQRYVIIQLDKAEISNAVISIQGDR